MRRHVKRCTWVPAAVLTVAVTVSACTPDPRALAERSIRDGSAKAALQAYFNDHPQCASVLSSTVPLGLNSESEADASPGEAALFEAGLLQERPKPELTLTDASPLADRMLANYARFAEPTPQASRWFRVDRTGAVPELSLCYGRREVTRVWTVLGDDLHGPTLHYAFRLVDVAPWTARPEIRRAFPFLDRVIGQELTGGEQLIVLDGDRWRLSYMYPHIVLPNGELEAFLHCPTRTGDAPLPGCKN